MQVPVMVLGRRAPDERHSKRHRPLAASGGRAAHARSCADRRPSGLIVHALGDRQALGPWPSTACARLRRGRDSSNRLLLRWRGR